MDANALDQVVRDAGSGGSAATDAPVPKMVRDGATGDADARAGGDSVTTPIGDAAAGGSELVATPKDGELAIVELLINPAGTDTGREWIEIVNRADHAVSLATLHIADLVNDVVVDFTSGGTTTAADAGSPTRLGPGARAVLMQSAEPTKNGGVTWPLNAVVGIFGTRVSLNNDADTIAVCAGACAPGSMLASVTWDSTVGGEFDGHALVIDDQGRRCPATVAFGDAGSFGTPFAANDACPH